jgi:flagellar motor switch/type III secretory pathway protein FliN
MLSARDYRPSPGFFLAKDLGQGIQHSRGFMSAVVQELNSNSTQPIGVETPQVALDSLDGLPWLPFTLSVEIPAVRFTIGDLLGLRTGSIVETGCHQTSDLPLRANGLLIGWTEFEVVGDRLAVRITEQI